MITNQPKFLITVEGFKLSVTASNEKEAFEIGRTWVDVKKGILPKRK